MKVIAQANETVLQILKNFKKTSDKNRMMHYCAHRAVEEGVLLFNLLTREMLLLTEEEFQNYTENDYLKERWFVVPEQTNEKAFADFVRSFLKRQQKPDGTITGYTIFTTMDCNARCFYCYEKGRSRMPMSRETAEKAAEYIKAHCGGKPIRFTWYGGEPLYNQEVIDIISRSVRNAGIEYKATIITNGYLFDEETARKAVDLWNTEKVQITLDGTEKVYNRVKAYIYPEGNPYQIVLGNIERLLDKNVHIFIRMNMDLYNAQDLLAVTKELGERFGGRENLSVYAYHIFNQDQTLAERHSPEEWEKREAAMFAIEQQIEQSGFTLRKGISSQPRLRHCMADSGQDITILPDGKIGLCDHYSESDFIGHIDEQGYDQEMVDSFAKTVPAIAECADCFYYPECVMLQKCQYENKCFLQYRQSKQRLTYRRMRNEYKQWKQREEA